MFENDNDVENTTSSDSSSENSEPTRPNRWKGAPSTWASLTAQERGLTASLDQIRNTELGIHLYNAYALKKHARDVSSAEDSEIKLEEEFLALPEEDRTFSPPRHWTAWPLPPEDVPREGEKIGPVDPDDEYTFRRREVTMPSAGLEEALVGVTLRFAKEVFMGRGDAGADGLVMLMKHEYEDMEGEGDEFMKDKGVEGTVGSGETEDTSGGPSGGASVDANVEVGMNSTMGKQAAAGNEDATQDSRESEGDPAQVVPVIKEASEPPQPQPLLKPVVSTDDDRSRELLRPSIRHTLSKLDEVLMALRHARMACRKYSHSETNTDDETQPVEEPTTPVKRPKGRPRKFANLPYRSRSNERSQAQPIDEADLLRAKKTHRGRPQKLYERLEGETQQEYLVRIARIQKKALPSFATPRDTRDASETGRSEKSPAKRATSEEREKDRRRRIRPRDWSEVLASAALVGFPPDVVARATQRCANLFRESMSMRILVERPFSEKDGDVLTHYQPQFIPDLGNEEVIESSENEDTEDSASESDNRVKRRVQLKDIRLGHPPLKQTCFCPVPECPRKMRGFNRISNLKRHLQQGHQIPKDELDEYILPSDEEMDGAVHVDGFLKPLKRMGGLRGKYKETGKRTRDESEEEFGGVFPDGRPKVADQKLPKHVEIDEDNGDSSSSDK